MPYKEREIIKKYYTIGEVASLLEVNTSLIRYWESEFEIINPKKNKKGTRKYTSSDLDLLKLIYRLLKKEKFTINGAKNYLKKNPKKNLITELKKLRDQLIKIRNKI